MATNRPSYSAAYYLGRPSYPVPPSYTFPKISYPGGTATAESTAADVLSNIKLTSNAASGLVKLGGPKRKNSRKSRKNSRKTRKTTRKNNRRR
jgi:hypothetical protein